MNPANLSEHAHQVGFYVDPTDPDGTELVGVTTAIGAAISKPFLATWKVKLAAEYAANHHEELTPLTVDERVAVIKEGGTIAADFAANKGTIVHRVMELHALGEISDAIWDDTAQGHVDAGLSFFTDFAPEVIWAEATVFRPEHGWGGTLDLVARINGQVWGLDYKTGAKLSPEVGLQLAAIRNASHAVTETATGWERLPLPTIDRVGAVHLKANGHYVLREVDTTDLYETFRAAVRMHSFGKLKNVLGEKIKPGDADTVRYQRQRARAVALSEIPGGLDALADAWGRFCPDVPTFRDSSTLTEADGDAVGQALSAAEKEVGASFPTNHEPVPKPRPLAPAYEPAAVVLVPGDHRIVARLAFMLDELPDDYADAIVAEHVRNRRTPSLSSGQANRQQVAAIALDLRRATKAAEGRRFLLDAHEHTANENRIWYPTIWKALRTTKARATAAQAERFGEVVDAILCCLANVTEVTGLELTNPGRKQLADLGKREAVAFAKTIDVNAPTRFADLEDDVPLACAVLVRFPTTKNEETQ